MRRLILLLLCASAWGQARLSGDTTLSGNSQFQSASPAPVTIASVSPPLGTVSTNYSFLIPVSGGIPPYTCSNTGILPNGAALSVAPSNQGCLISGLLSAGSGGTYTGIAVTATDSIGGHATSSPPYTITIVFPQQLGPPNYLGAIQSLAPIQLPSTFPIMGTNACPGNSLPCYTLGTNTVITDPSFNSAVPTVVFRVTDANTECGVRNGFSFFMDVGGSGDANMFSANDGHFIINDNGNAYLMMGFNPSTFAVTPMYPSIYGCPGGRGLLDVPAGEFSYSNDNIYYGIQTTTSCAATSCPNQTSVSKIDVSSPTAPVFTNIFDFKNCLPPGSSAVSWVSQGGVDVNDRYFAQAASTTGGGQNSGGDAMFFDSQTQICYLYDTIGNVDSARTAIALTGATAVYTKATQQVVITVPNSFTAGQNLYMIGITGVLSPLSGYAINLTATSTSTITGNLVSSLGHADISGTIGGPSCVGTPTVQCPNIGTMNPGMYKFVGSSCAPGPANCTVWTMSFVGYAPSNLGSWTVHNDKIGKTGAYDVVDLEICLTTCLLNDQIDFWLPQAITPTVCPYSNSGGHWTEGNSTWVNEGGSSKPYFSWEGFTVCNPPTAVPPSTNINVCTSATPNPGNAQCLIFPIPGTCNASLLPTPCITNYDGHPNWNTNNPLFRSTWSFAADTTPITTDIYSAKQVFGVPFFGPWINEVVILNACVFNTTLPAGCHSTGNVVLREGHTYNTSQNSHFDTKFEIGNGDQKGKFYFFSTDHGGQLGQAAGVGSNVAIKTTAITSLVGTFTHPTSPVLTAGQQVALYGFTSPLTALNGIYVTVSAFGLSTTQFQALLPAGTANIGSTTTNASATVVTCVTGALTNCRGDIEGMLLQ